MSVSTMLRASDPQRRRCLGILFAAVLVLLCNSGRALAGPQWTISALANTTVESGGTLTYVIQPRNDGDTETDGTDSVLTVTLPPGVTGVSATPAPGVSCPGVAGATVITCTRAFPVQPFAELLTRLTVNVGAQMEGAVLLTTFEISGGGPAAPVSTVEPVTVSARSPGFGIDCFDVVVTGEDGQPLTQAGAHPLSAETSIAFNTHTDPSPQIGDRRPVEATKDLIVDLPPGFVGNPTAASRCTVLELSNNAVLSEPRPLCAPTSQVGTVLVKHSAGTTGSGSLFGPLPVFNMVPPPDVPARFGFNVLGTVVVLDASVRTGGDYGVTVTGKNISEGLAVVASTFTLWGVPSDPSHTSQRACAGEPNPSQGGPTCMTGVTPTAFLRNPTSCAPQNTGLPTTLTIDSWQHPGTFVSMTVPSHDPPGFPYPPSLWGPQRGTDGCGRVPFDPTFSAQPFAGSRAGAPMTMSFDIGIPQTDDPDTTAQSDLRTATVTLPQGVRVTPASAEGLQACSPSQIALRSDSDANCPEASKIGSVQIDTPLLDEPVKGAIYLATPFDNPFSSLVALYIVARAQGVTLKLPGQVTMDLVGGQIATRFDNNPQLPFSRLHVELKTGPRSPLSVTRRCGLFTSHAELVGWNGRTVSQDSSFTLSENAKGKPCPPQFSPGFRAGTKSNSAGKSSPFLMRFTREDEDQELSGLTVDLPRGLTGRVADVDLCTDAQARANTCPAGSKIGDVTVGAGAGSNPFFITNGRMYLTGPYKGAPFGASIVVPAVAGPFDLGLVTTRAAVFVDKHDASVRVVSDPLPTILQGIPLDVRDVRVSVTKPGFWLNPTSCAEKRIAARLTSTEGATANVSDRFQAADCASLGFKPKLTLKVGGRGHTRRARTTPLTATVRMPRGGANLRYVRVVLPTSINARLTVINDACTRAEFESDISKCDHARAGTAKVVTPLLRDPVKGSTYFVKNGHPIPDLALALRGQIDLDVFARVTIPGGKHLATTFTMVPDAPLSTVTVTVFGDAKNGSVGAAANLCAARNRSRKAQLSFIGQNGKVQQVDQALTVAGCGKQKARRTGRRR